MPYFTWHRRGRIAGALAITACAALTASAPALADVTTDDTAPGTSNPVTATTTPASRAECTAPGLFQPFSSWKDSRNYVLAPGGDFTDPAGGGWQLERRRRGSSTTRNPDGTVDGVLDLPSGAVAVSPTMCVDLDYPTARAWVRGVAGDGDVDVSVVYDAGKSAQVPKKVGRMHGQEARVGPVRDVKIQPQLAGKQSGWRLVAFVLSAGGKDGEFRVDDFYVDPRMVR